MGTIRRTWADIYDGLKRDAILVYFPQNPQSRAKSASKTIENTNPIENIFQPWGDDIGYLRGVQYKH